MKITEIADKGATIAWSPCRGQPDIIALGTKVRKGMIGVLQYFLGDLSCRVSHFGTISSLCMRPQFRINNSFTNATKKIIPLCCSSPIFNRTRVALASRTPGGNSIFMI